MSAAPGLTVLFCTSAQQVPRSCHEGLRSGTCLTSVLAWPPRHAPTAPPCRRSRISSVCEIRPAPRFPLPKPAFSPTAAALAVTIPAEQSAALLPERLLRLHAAAAQLRDLTVPVRRRAPSTKPSSLAGAHPAKTRSTRAPEPVLAALQRVRRHRATACRSASTGRSHCRDRKSPPRSHRHRYGV